MLAGRNWLSLPSVQVPDRDKQAASVSKVAEGFSWSRVQLLAYVNLATKAFYRSS